MSSELIISISGMRGIVGQSLTATTGCEYAAAFGTYLKKAAGHSKEKLKVCIGRDSRPSGQTIASAVIAGLCSTGIDVIDVGIVTTPGVGIMLRELACAGGVVITASHNPVEYNGIKLLLQNGIAPPAAEAEKIKAYYLEKNFSFVSSAQCGHFTSNENTDSLHIEKILKLVNKNAIKTFNFKVVLDSVNGAGGRAGKKILEELGCKVIAINYEPTGLFAHTPEPTEQNLTGLCDDVRKTGADIGFAQDPDADRLAIVDENGKYIGEEYTLALAAKYILAGRKGAAATNLSTSRMIDDIAEDAGCNVIRTAVGEANVAGAMIENNCVIGGEGNGGVIDLRVGPIRDSLVGIAFVLALMAETKKTISELVGRIKSYHVIKQKIEADKNKAAQIINSAKKSFSNAKVNTTDGCRFDLEDGWIHLRSSNTEPVMRIIVEAKDKDTAEKYINQVTNIIKKSDQ